MLSPIFEPRTRSEETIVPNWMKLGINKLHRNTNNIIEAFFDILPTSGDMGPLWATPWGPWGVKIFFLIFQKMHIPWSTYWSLLHPKVLICPWYWVITSLQGAKRIQIWWKSASPGAEWGISAFACALIHWKQMKIVVVWCLSFNRVVNFT